MQTLQQIITTLTAIVLFLSAQVGNLGQTISPSSQLAQVIQTISYVQSASNVEYFNSDTNISATFGSAVTVGNYRLFDNPRKDFIFWNRIETSSKHSNNSPR